MQNMHLQICYFNSQPHEEADSPWAGRYLWSYRFQLTASRRGWQRKFSIFGSDFIISTHSLTKRLTFTPATPLRTFWNFNSQPHEEADFSHYVICGMIHISTHSLTKRLTLSLPVWDEIAAISTHSLTKRLTRLPDTIQMSLLFQLTASRRGWLFHPATRTCEWDISTHSLTKRLTITCTIVIILCLFQLTASRRGWLGIDGNTLSLNTFQLTASRRGWRLTIK